MKIKLFLLTSLLLSSSAYALKDYPENWMVDKQYDQAVNDMLAGKELTDEQMLTICWGDIREATGMLLETYDVAPDIKNACLYDAASSINLPGVKALIAAGADLNFKDPNDDGSTALIRAAINSSAEVMQELLKAGADPNIKNDSNESVSDYVCKDRPATEHLRPPAKRFRKS
ncbi:MAG: ankyrin repeat domain-containing protein [Candidatus Thiothrix singaporensis]|uniref:Ankyrin repeat domain-containing protein n=1 Tax=Candidatus Thiothrix singaporensis TaxID=2799669 RepID=A0A7L6AP70_9GAMM|nr:MAG: ankyrin repeat domain-containing protein [Candidatus Thiothrix singaporensis]